MGGQGIIWRAVGDNGRSRDNLERAVGENGRSQNNLDRYTGDNGRLGDNLERAVADYCNTREWSRENSCMSMDGMQEAVGDQCWTL